MYSPTTPELGQLTGVTSNRFDLSDNELCADVPTEVQALSSSITSNWEVTTSNSIGTMCEFVDDARFDIPTTETRLSYSGDDLTGTIPTEFGLLTGLTYVTLGSNDLTGTIPTEFALLTAVTIMTLVSNSLTGYIPTELGLMTGLKGVYLRHNSLNGQLPTQFGLLTGVSQLALQVNSLSGQLPTDLGSKFYKFPRRDRQNNLIIRQELRSTAFTLPTLSIPPCPEQICP